LLRSRAKQRYFLAQGCIDMTGLAHCGGNRAGAELMTRFKAVAAQGLINLVRSFGEGAARSMVF
jgi:hypothetical protein